MSAETANSTLCFVTRKPAVDTWQFAEELAQDSKAVWFGCICYDR